MKKNTAAFTLIEVLIALLIIAIALAAAIQATDASIRTTIHVRNSLAAHWVGLNVLSEIQTGLILLPKSSSQLSGKTSMLEQRWDWTARSNTSSQLPDVNQMSVTVSLKNHVINSVVGYVK
jgi:general secretion pathway protein I